MPLDPDKKPKEFLTILVAIGLKIFANKPWSDSDYFIAAENFIQEAENRYGKLNK